MVSLGNAALVSSCKIFPGQAGSIRRASKTGIETVAQDLLVPVEDGRQTVLWTLNVLRQMEMGI